MCRIARLIADEPTNKERTLFPMTSLLPFAAYFGNSKLALHSPQQIGQLDSCIPPSLTISSFKVV